MGKKIYVCLIAAIFCSVAIAQTKKYTVFYNSNGERLEIREKPNERGEYISGIWNQRLGEFITDCNYDFSGFTAPRNGYCVIKQLVDRINWITRVAIINSDLNFTVPFDKYEHIIPKEIPDNCWAAGLKNGKWGIIDGRGKIIAPFIFEYVGAEPNINGMIRAKANGKYGLIDRYGNTCYPFVLDDIQPIGPLLEDRANQDLFGDSRFTKPKSELVYAFIKYNGHLYWVDHNLNIINEDGKKIASNNTSSSNSSLGPLIVAGAIIAGAAALISSLSKSSSSSSSSSSTSTSSSSSQTLYEGCNVKCFMWKGGSGYYGRVTEINGDKCKVYIDKVALKGLLTLYIGACQYTGWKDLSYTTRYDTSFNKQFYGRGTIIEVPKYCLVAL